MKKRIFPALPMAAAFALLFSVPVFADVVFFPHRLVSALIVAGIVLLLMCISAAAVLIIIFTRKSRNSKGNDKK